MTNEAAILGILAELYAQRAALQAENAALRQLLDEMRADAEENARRDPL